MGEALSVADVLERAADVVAKPGGWMQGSMGSDGCYCAWGAIIAASVTGDPSKACRFFSGFVGGMVQFNDTPGRTQSEVVAKLREAAALARSPTPAQP